MSKLRFFYIFFLKPGLTKTFYLMKDFQFSLEGAVYFMLENLKNQTKKAFSPRPRVKSIQDFSTLFKTFQNSAKHLKTGH